MPRRPTVYDKSRLTCTLITAHGEVWKKKAIPLLAVFFRLLRGVPDALNGFRVIPGGAQEGLALWEGRRLSARLRVGSGPGSGGRGDLRTARDGLRHGSGGTCLHISPPPAHALNKREGVRSRERVRDACGRAASSVVPWVDTTRSIRYCRRGERNQVVWLQAYPLITWQPYAS
eukprot:scaffold20_cov361-Prasinococcus_capsulatus_cf.AAC.6